MTEVTSQWIEATNEQFRKNNIAFEQRCQLVWFEWLKQNEESSTREQIWEAQGKVFSWFETRTQISKQYIGWMFVGSFYFDTLFWPVFIPVIYGQIKLDIFDALKTMSPFVMKSLRSNKTECLEYASLWVDCLDFAGGIDKLCGDSGSNPTSSFSEQLFRSGRKHLEATVSQLHQTNPNAKAMEDARMTTEIFLKAYLSSKAGLTDEAARKEIGHDLDKALERSIIEGLTELSSIRSRITIFPEIKERYTESERTLGEIWSAYRVAQSVATTVTRSLSKRDSRPNLKLGFRQPG